MCYVIITCRSMLWSLLSITSFMMLLAAVTSPQWLIGFSRLRGLSAEPFVPTGHRDVDDNNSSSAAYTSNQNDFVDDYGEVNVGKESYRPTLGIFNRCLKLMQYEIIPRRENCATFVTDFLLPDSEFPDAWKATLVFFSLAGVLLLITSLAAVLSLCLRNCFGKSVFTLSGLLQSVAALLCVLALVVYPAGWGSDKVKAYCGQLSGPFNLDRCQFGWSFYIAVAGTAVNFLCAGLSIYAESATSSHKVEQQIIEGNYLICVV